MEALSLKDGEEYLETKYVNSMIYGLVINGLASYHDLLHKYDINEVLDLCEMLIVKQENETIFYNSKRSVKK